MSGEMTRVAQSAITGAGGQLVLGKPKEILKHVTEVANMLMEVVHKQNLYQKFGSSEHITVPAWQFAGHFFDITAKIVSCEPYVDDITGAAGFKAKAEAIRHGEVVSAAEAICLNNEDNWNERPKYDYKNVPGIGRERVIIGSVKVPSFQLMSMAQTRAMGKVLSNVLRFVAVLAGFADTPAEEMTGNEYDQRQPSEQHQGKDTQRKSEQAKPAASTAAPAAAQHQEQPQQTSQPAGNGGAKAGPITEGQLKRLHAIRKEVNCPANTAGQIVISHGFDIAANVTKDKYDAVIADIQNWNVPK
jgi:hypothetical protein